jgi:glyoxylase-like metal-dependent hydrolase (beta-lactamase superfamily II)
VTLVDVADGCAAYFQPDGSWGLSNAGLVVSGEHALLVDTLYDEKRTRLLLDAASSKRANIDVLVNTHANGDHCFGNAVVASRFPSVRILATRSAAEEMPEIPPSLMAWANRAMRVLRHVPGARFGPTSVKNLAEYWLAGFARFDFAGIALHAPTSTFSASLTVSVGDVDVELIELGPAHTKGDAIAWVPSKRVLFTGDLLFHQGTPICWVGPLSRWIAACDRMLALDPAVVVPGHGPLASTPAIAAVRDYFAFVDAAARERLRSGMRAFDAARDILASSAFRSSPWAEWSERERIAVNVECVARELKLGKPKKPFALFAEMAALART